MNMATRYSGWAGRKVMPTGGYRLCRGLDLNERGYSGMETSLPLATTTCFDCFYHHCFLSDLSFFLATSVSWGRSTVRDTKRSSEARKSATLKVEDVFRARF